MAKIRVSILVQAVSGAIGGNIFRQTRNGLVLATRPRARKFLSQTQLANRARFQFIRAYYFHTLTDAQRVQWTTVASQIPLTDRVGVTRFLTGLQLFVKQSMQDEDLSSINDTPGNLEPGIVMLGVDWDCTEGGPFTLSITDASNTGGNMSTAFARPISTRPLNFSRHWKKPAARIAPATPSTSRDLHTKFVEVWGEPAAGERIGLRVWRHGSRFLPSPTQEIWVFVQP